MRPTATEYFRRISNEMFAFSELKISITAISSTSHATTAVYLMPEAVI